MGVQTLENSYLHVSMTNVDMLNSLNLLGTDIQRFTKGLQPTSAGMYVCVPADMCVCACRYVCVSPV